MAKARSDESGVDLCFEAAQAEAAIAANLKEPGHGDR